MVEKYENYMRLLSEEYEQLFGEKLFQKYSFSQIVDHNYSCKTETKLLKNSMVNPGIYLLNNGSSVFSPFQFLTIKEQDIYKDIMVETPLLIPYKKCSVCNR